MARPWESEQPAASLNALQVLADLQGIEIPADKVRPRLPFRKISGMDVGVDRIGESPCDLSHIGMSISFLLHQHMPNRNKQLACDRHNRLVAADPGCKPIEFRLPMRVGPNRDLRRVDQGGAQILASSLGDSPSGACISRIMDPRTETCIAHQVPGFGEALDCADGSQDGERSNEPNARELDKKREPGISTCLLYTSDAADE